MRYYIRATLNNCSFKEMKFKQLIKLLIEKFSSTNIDIEELSELDWEDVKYLNIENVFHIQKETHEKLGTSLILYLDVSSSFKDTSKIKEVIENLKTTLNNLLSINDYVFFEIIYKINLMTKKCFEEKEFEKFVNLLKSSDLKEKELKYKGKDDEEVKKEKLSEIPLLFNKEISLTSEKPFFSLITTRGETHISVMVKNFLLYINEQNDLANAVYETIYITSLMRKASQI